LKTREYLAFGSTLKHAAHIQNACHPKSFLAYVRYFQVAKKWNTTTMTGGAGKARDGSIRENSCRISRRLVMRMEGLDVANWRYPKEVQFEQELARW
jgi:hypothetical protein